MVQYIGLLVPIKDKTKVGLIPNTNNENYYGYVESNFNKSANVSTIKIWKQDTQVVEYSIELLHDYSESIQYIEVLELPFDKLLLNEKKWLGLLLSKKQFVFEMWSGTGAVQLELIEQTI
jgi:hypothetical protein